MPLARDPQRCGTRPAHARAPPAPDDETPDEYRHEQQRPALPLFRERDRDGCTGRVAVAVRPPERPEVRERSPGRLRLSVPTRVVGLAPEHDAPPWRGSIGTERPGATDVGAEGGPDRIAPAD